MHGWYVDHTSHVDSNDPCLFDLFARICRNYTCFGELSVPNVALQQQVNFRQHVSQGRGEDDPTAEAGDRRHEQLTLKISVSLKAAKIIVHVQVGLIKTRCNLLLKHNVS